MAQIFCLPHLHSIFFVTELVSKLTCCYPGCQCSLGVQQKIMGGLREDWDTTGIAKSWWDFLHFFKGNLFTTPLKWLSPFTQPLCKEQDVDSIPSECIIPNGAYKPGLCHHCFRNVCVVTFIPATEFKYYCCFTYDFNRLLQNWSKLSCPMLWYRPTMSS